MLKEKWIDNNTTDLKKKASCLMTKDQMAKCEKLIHNACAVNLYNGMELPFRAMQKIINE